MRLIATFAVLTGLLAAAGPASASEPDLGASGTPFKGPLKSGAVWGYADAHLHITADMRAGGRVIHGKAFDPGGVEEALGHDADDHGPDGILDVTGNLLRSGLPVGTHDNGGWPGFAGWPTHDTITHQQIYHRWLQRAWLAGERLVVAQTVEDEPLCRIEPVKSQPCDEQTVIGLQVARLRGLERYVDAQAGGLGRGWFRLVEDPAAARRAIEDGKLAVVIGAEWSNPFGCSQLLGVPACDRADIDRGISRLRALGVRSTFIAHWVDNALSGPALEGGDKGLFIGALQLSYTGAVFGQAPCPEAGQGEEVVLPPSSGRVCNPKGLTELGRYAVTKLMDAHMLIEVDHMSETARRQVLTMAEARHYPLVSSHTGTGGAWTRSELQRLRAVGGFATATIDDPAQLAAKLLRVRADAGGLRAVGLGSDTGGFADLPGPPPGPALAYPFSSFDGKVSFTRQRTGERTFDLNADGVAHYGLLPDLLAKVQAQPRGAEALATLFGSAESYIRTWERTGLDAAAPVITRLGVTRKRVSFRLSETARVRIVLRRGNRTRRLVRQAKRGSNRITIRSLRRGTRYRLSLTATDPSGNRAVKKRTVHPASKTVFGRARQSSAPARLVRGA